MRSSAIVKGSPMHAYELQVIDAALRWRALGHRVHLATVLATHGASPRPAGSMAVIRDDGLVVGSVSGGCIEDDLIHEVRHAPTGLASARPAIRVFGADAHEQARYRLPCNNTVRIAIESAWDPQPLHQAVEAIGRQRTVRRCVAFADGRSWLEEADGADKFEQTEAFFAVSLGPRQRALLIGAGELGHHVAALLRTLEFAVRVCEPREEYAQAWTLPGLPLERRMPDDWIVECRPDGRTAVLALAHDPKLDELALIEALKTPAFYVGAIGSAATTFKRRQRLALFDLEPAQIRRLRGPVGLPISSRTPAEIAVSIAADLIQVRNGAAAATGSAPACARAPS